jgi:hypothetical protein
MRKNIVLKGVILSIILLFLTSTTITSTCGNHINKSMNIDTNYIPLNSNNEIIIETQFEEAWILDNDGDYLAPPGWDVDGICTSHQSGLLYDCFTHYWNILYWNERDLPDFDLTTLINSGDSSACVWWSDGTGESVEVGQRQDEWLITPELDLSNYYQIQLTFWSTYYWGEIYSNHSNFIKVTTNNGETWELITDLVHDSEWKLGGELEGWMDWNNYEYPVVIDLSAYALEPSVRIAWHHIYPSPGMDYGGHAIWAIDDVSISGIKDTQNPEISLIQPKESTIYLNGEALAQWPFPTLIIGPIEFTFDVTDEESGVDYIELFMNTELKITLDSEPYSWVWNQGGIGIYTIKATGFDYIGNSASTNEMMVIKIQLF